MRKAIELTDRKFGMLTVLNKVEGTKNGTHGFYNCLCECGNKKVVYGRSLFYGNTKSCGCLWGRQTKYKVGQIINKRRLIKHFGGDRWETECINCGQKRIKPPWNKDKCHNCTNTRTGDLLDGWEIKDKKLKRKLSNYKTNAKIRGYEFRLSSQQFTELCLSNCHYCGSIPSPYNGIDRKINDIGYLAENCVSCCSKCNYMKSDSSQEDFIEQCKKVAFNIAKNREAKNVRNNL